MYYILSIEIIQNEMFVACQGLAFSVVEVLMPTIKLLTWRFDRKAFFLHSI